MDMTKPARKEVIEKTKVVEIKKGSSVFDEYVSAECNELWAVFIWVRSGTILQTPHVLFFDTKEEASEFAGKIQIGIPVSDQLDIGRVANEECDFEGIRESIDLNKIRTEADAEADEKDSLEVTYRILSDAGVINFESRELCGCVIDFIGADRITFLKSDFLDKWKFVAAYEYCSMKYSSTAPATISSFCLYSYFVLNDKFYAGYMLRDLEFIIHGVEAEAQKAADKKKMAGEKGKAASKRGRNDRRMALLEAMETFAKRNPDMIAFGDKEIARLSLPKCVDTDPTLWAQGRKQVGEYLDEIRRGEAGPDAKARYHALFPAKTA